MGDLATGGGRLSITPTTHPPRVLLRTPWALLPFEAGGAQALPGAVAVAGTQEEAREAVPPGTLPVTDGSAVLKEALAESRPYTIASRHERRRSS